MPPELMLDRHDQECCTVRTHAPLFQALLNGHGMSTLQLLDDLRLELWHENIQKYNVQYLLVSLNA